MPFCCVHFEPVLQPKPMWYMRSRAVSAPVSSTNMYHHALDWFRAPKYIMFVYITDADTGRTFFMIHHEECFMQPELPSARHYYTG